MRRLLHLFCCCLFINVSVAQAQEKNQGTLQLTALAGDSQKKIPCWVHLTDAKGKATRVQHLPFWRDHFVCDGQFQTKLPVGNYTYEIERGPEYLTTRGKLLIKKDSTTNVKVRLKRFINMKNEGWWSGELHVHRALTDIPLLMRAEDLHVAPVITWWNGRNFWQGRKVPKDLLRTIDNNRHYHLMAGEDEREGGALLYFNLRNPLPITKAGREYPSPMHFVNMLKNKKHQVWVDIEKPFWWDVPTWLAFGFADSIGLANNHMCRSQMLPNEAWGKPRIVERLPNPRGNGYWTQEIYYHILNTGIRIPPSAGSASGVLPNPVGYNRVYVHLGKTLDYQEWFKGLKAGKVFVTNGPLLRVRASGKLPGHVFNNPKGKSLTLNVDVNLSTKDTIPFVEVVKNGIVERKIPFSEVQKNKSIGKITFEKSGWFLIRAITDNKKTFRFASTGPFYVEIGTERRVSRKSVKFFQDWIKERQLRVKLPEGKERDSVLSYHRQAAEFWKKKSMMANAP